MLLFVPNLTCILGNISLWNRVVIEHFLSERKHHHMERRRVSTSQNRTEERKQQRGCRVIFFSSSKTFNNTGASDSSLRQHCARYHQLHRAVNTELALPCRLHSSVSPVLTATGSVNGKWQFSTYYRIDTT